MIFLKAKMFRNAFVIEQKRLQYPAKFHTAVSKSISKKLIPTFEPRSNKHGWKWKETISSWPSAWLLCWYERARTRSSRRSQGLACPVILDGNIYFSISNLRLSNKLEYCSIPRIPNKDWFFRCHQRTTSFSRGNGL